MSTGSYEENPLMKGDDPNLVKLYGDRTAQNNCQYLLPHIKPTSIILDVGCGPGRITSDLAHLAPLGKVTGLDSNAGIITTAQTTFPSSTQANLTFVVGNALKLDFPDNTFDIVHAHQVLLHLRDPLTALKEFHRVLKPSGFIAVRENSAGIVQSLSPDLPSIRSYLKRAQELMPQTGMDPFAGQKLEGWVKEAGFVKIVGSKSGTWGPSHLSQVTGQTAEMAVKYGMATEEELKGWREGWVEWEGTEGREFVLEAGEVLGWKE